MKNLFTAFFAALTFLSAGAQQLAIAQIDEPSEWRSFVVGEALAAGQAENDGTIRYWRTVPTRSDLQFSYLQADPAKTNTINYGKLDFTVRTEGLVWMLTTTRYTSSGNSSGGWLPEVSFQRTLETNGWRLVTNGFRIEYGTLPAGQNQNLLDLVLFERLCAAGERFSIRTEKYLAPVILQPVSLKVSRFEALTWPTNSASLRIEAAKSLDGPWAPITILPTATNRGRFSANLPFKQKAEFFRLVP